MPEQTTAANVIEEKDAANIPLNMEPVRTDKMGNTFYQFKNDPGMTYKRFFSASIYDRFIRMGLTPQFMEMVIDLGLKVAFNTQKTEQQLREDFVNIFQNLKMRFGYVCSEDPYLQLAAVYFLLPGEPLEEVDPSWTQKKIALWNRDPETKDFFLREVFKDINGSDNISADDMKAFFQMGANREANIPTLPKE